MKQIYEEEDFVLEPRSNKNKQDREEDDWYPFEVRMHTYKPLPMMEYRKKRAVEEYNIRRKQFEVEQKAQHEARKALENADIPRDVIDEILVRAGFYIPRALVFRKD